MRYLGKARPGPDMFRYGAWNRALRGHALYGGGVEAPMAFAAAPVEERLRPFKKGYMRKKKVG